MFDKYTATVPDEIQFLVFKRVKTLLGRIKALDIDEDIADLMKLDYFSEYDRNNRHALIRVVFPAFTEHFGLDDEFTASVKISGCIDIFVPYNVLFHNSIKDIFVKKLYVDDSRYKTRNHMVCDFESIDIYETEAKD